MSSTTDSRIDLWPPAGKGLTSWLLLVMFIIFLAHLSCSDKVSFCDRSLSVVRRRHPSPVNNSIDLNDISS